MTRIAKGALAGQIREIPITKIDRHPRQPREFFDDDHIDALAHSIAAIGLVHEILVRPKGDRFELICGECRLRAVSRLKYPTIMARIREFTEREVIAAMGVENFQRRPFNPIERANFLKLATDPVERGGGGYSPNEAVKICGAETKAFVLNNLRLLDLPDEVKRLMTRPKSPLKETMARELLRYDKNPSVFKALTDYVVSHDWICEYTRTAFIEEITKVKEKAEGSAGNGAHQSGPSPEWSQPMLKKQLAKQLNVSVKALNDRLVEGTTAVPGKIRFERPSPRAKLLRFALQDIR